MENIRYQTSSAQPGILFEIFLPKRIEYLSGLYALLHSGHNQSTIDKYFRSEENVKRCRKLMPKSLREGWPPTIMQKVYYGFSIYEVDGVFFSTEQTDAVQDRTLVIRLLMRPGYRTLLAEVQKEHRAPVKEHVRTFRKLPLSVNRQAVDRYMRMYVNNEIAQKQDQELKDPALRESIDRSLRAVYSWMIDVYSFVFGYVIGGITAISNLKEEEIWVTSYRSPVINVVRRKVSKPVRDAQGSISMRDQP